MGLFKPASRSRVPLKIAVTGPSGSGKTYSALTIAAGLAPGGKIAVVDTENGSASLYADKFAFDSAEVSPPYTVDRFVAALKEAEAAGYAVVILDSISHEWAGTGGILSRKSDLDLKPGSNQYANWKEPSREHDRFLAAILESSMDVICTMRSKQDYVLVQDGGKQKPQKVGMAPIQRDGVEYEFSVVLDLTLEHVASVSKDRTGVLDGQVFKPTAETGKVLAAWRATGKPLAPREAVQTPDKAPAEPLERRSPPQADPEPSDSPTASETSQEAKRSEAYRSVLAKFEKEGRTNLKGCIGYFKIRRAAMSDDEADDLSKIEVKFREMAEEGK